MKSLDRGLDSRLASRDIYYVVRNTGREACALPDVTVVERRGQTTVLKAAWPAEPPSVCMPLVMLSVACCLTCRWGGSRLRVEGSGLRGSKSKFVLRLSVRLSVACCLTCLGLMVEGVAG